MGRTIIVKGADFSENGFKNLLKDNSKRYLSQQGYLGSVYANKLTYNDTTFWTYGIQVETGKRYRFISFAGATGCNIASVASNATPVVSPNDQFTTPQMVEMITHFSSAQVTDVEFLAQSDYLLFSCETEDSINSMALIEVD